jgi:antitoxin component YwqK of YwqJK toxin-antitoxin module
MKKELTPHIEYYSNGDVWIKGQLNSKGQREGLWEFFYLNGNIKWRTSYKEGKKDGIQTFYDEQGNITGTRLWKNGEVIETTKH